MIDSNVLRSDDFPADLVGATRKLLGSRVILCTLSMLSNDKISNFTQIVPIQTVIFDEASQIEIGDYLPMLIRFRPTLRKLIFIGDNKQCESDGLCTFLVLIFLSVAPYGSSDIPTLHSIFEKSHMLKQAVFLDTQC
jgi:superfamily I DNA and/or RNA helicase